MIEYNKFDNLYKDLTKAGYELTEIRDKDRSNSIKKSGLQAIKLCGMEFVGQIYIISDDNNSKWKIIINERPNGKYNESV